MCVHRVSSRLVSMMYSKIQTILSEFKNTPGPLKFYHLAMYGVPIEFDTERFILCGRRDHSRMCTDLVLDFVKVSLDLGNTEQAMTKLYEDQDTIDLFIAHDYARYDHRGNKNFELAWSLKFSDPQDSLEIIKSKINAQDNLQVLRRLVYPRKAFWPLLQKKSVQYTFQYSRLLY
jgi:hypothetical protein